jgi:muconolactone delta-isomerase
MLFLVRTQFQRPVTMADTEFTDLQREEKRRAVDLQHAGVIQRLWREPGTVVAWGLWCSDDEEVLLSLMRSLPAYPWMTVSYHEVIDHPNARSPS